jgi:hypothetical protein
MQVTETLNEGLKRAYTITVTAAELDAKVQEKLVEAQPEVEMKGFRKGKVPMAMLRKQFGARLMGDAMQDAIDGAMKSHFDASGDRPALQPEVKMVGGESWAEGQDVVVEMTYEALPPIPEFDAGNVVLQRLVVKAEASAVDEALANLAGSAQSFEDRKKGSKAKDGDRLCRVGGWRGVRGRVGGRLSAGARLRFVHSGLRRTAHRCQGGGCSVGQRDLPRGLRGQASGRQGRRFCLHGEGREGTEAGRSR